MQEYDRLGMQWLAYLMFFNAPNHRSLVVNTDERGFRHTWTRPAGGGSNAHDRRASLVVGGSTAFGVGVSSDAHTLASLLSQETEDQWLNFGGRAFNSTQELMLFLFSPRPAVKRIILFTGMNDLAIHQLSEAGPDWIGRVFFGSQIYAALNRLTGRNRKRALLRLTALPLFGEAMDYDRITLRELVTEIFRHRRQTADVIAARTNVIEKGRDRVLDFVRQNLHTWACLSRSQGFELTYVLQPFADWIPRQLSPEETTVFGALSREPEWNAIRQATSDPGTYEWYSGALSKICSELAIPFVDSNKALAEAPDDGRWLFVDRVHLTDAGMREVAAHIVAEVL